MAMDGDGLYTPGRLERLGTTKPIGSCPLCAWTSSTARRSNEYTYPLLKTYMGYEFKFRVSGKLQAATCATLHDQVTIRQTGQNYEQDKIAEIAKRQETTSLLQQAFPPHQRFDNTTKYEHSRTSERVQLMQNMPRMSRSQRLEFRQVSHGIQLLIPRKWMRPGKAESPKKTEHTLTSRNRP